MASSRKPGEIGFPNHAEMVQREREALARLDFRNLRIDKAAVEEAVTEYLALCGARARALRWFADALLARAYLSYRAAVRAYWPLDGGNHALPLEAAWQAGASGWYHS